MRFLEQAVFEGKFRQENAQFLVERARFALWAALILYPLFWFLDRLIAPHLATSFLALRVAVGVSFAVSLVLLHTPFAARLARLLVATCSTLAAAAISVMASRLGGFDSTYFVGVVIVLYVVGFFIPWGLTDVSIFCGVVIATYLWVNLQAHGPSVEMATPLFFLVGTAVFTYLATLSNRRTRRRDLSLRLRLEGAYTELAELDEAKTRFFANVSHELRTPLTMLYGPLDTLMTTESDAERLRLLQSMATNARRLLRQVNALLEVAKMESGRLTLELREADLGRLLRDLVEATAPHAAGRGIALTAEGLDNLPKFPFDGDKVEMVAANLLSNAVKFTPRGGHVHVRAERQGLQMVFEVADDGPGIPEDQQGEIFERFHQVDSSLSREQEGVGLGLALARELVRLHGGTISVDSRLGEGSTFRVELPLQPQGVVVERRRKPRRKEDQLALARTEMLTARAYSSRLKSRTLLADVESPQLDEEEAAAAAAPPGAPCVLLVDDNVDLRTFLARRLSHHYRVVTAADGVEGLEAAVRTSPDLIVSDIMMPRMDGTEFCRRLRADPAFATTPIVLVTAKTGEEAVVEGLELGADDYVTKPFAMRELEARIAAHLRAREIERHLHERESRLVAIGEMTSAVVHDLRNPLTLVKGYADLALGLAQRGGEPTAIVDELGKLKGAADRLRRMIQEILDYARSGAAELDIRPAPAAKFLDHTVTSFAGDLERRGISTSVEIDLDPKLTAPLDQERLRRAIENLLTNAREALVEFEGDRRVRVGARVEDSSLVIRVADSGPGVPEELADRIFEPFATTGKKRGTGLGLATVRNVVRAHGGEIAFEGHSDEGGAAFTIRLPLATAPQAS